MPHYQLTLFSWVYTNAELRANVVLLGVYPCRTTSQRCSPGCIPMLRYELTMFSWVYTNAALPANVVLLGVYPCRVTS